LDDGSPDLKTSLAMARIASEDGIDIIACTPHIMPGVYNNSAPGIEHRIEALRDVLNHEGIELQLVSGADVHVAADLVTRIRTGEVLTLNYTRYFLLEPPEHILPPRFEEFVFSLNLSGYVPILTHPERLGWIEARYDLIERLADGGVLMQLTAGSLTGRFGRRPRYWSERMLEEGRVHLLATDAHDTRRRPPILSEASDLVARRLGADEADRLVERNPLHILENVLLSRPSGRRSAGKKRRNKGGFWGWATRIAGR